MIDVLLKKKIKKNSKMNFNFILLFQTKVVVPVTMELKNQSILEEKWIFVMDFEFVLATASARGASARENSNLDVLQ